MITNKYLLTTGLVLAVAGVATATPSLRLSRAGSTPAAGQTGSQIQIIGVVNDALPDGAILGATVKLQWDPATVGTLTAADLSYNSQNWSAAANFGTGQATIAFQNIAADGNGLTATGPIATITLHPAMSAKLKASNITLLGASDTTDYNYMTVAIGSDVTAPVLPGTVKDLGGTISGAVSVGVAADNSRVIAAVATTGTASSLHLLKAADLSDIGTPAALAGPISGRPAFGYVGGNAVVAVGDDTGALSIYNVSDASAVGSPVALGSKATTPAIDNATGNIYVGANQTGAAPNLDRVVSGAIDNAQTLEGTTVEVAPAFVAGGIAVGTDTKLMLFRDSGTGPFTPQATITDPQGFTKSSPVLRADGMGLVAADSGNVYQVNLTTGTIGDTPVAATSGAAPFSEGFPTATGAVFGGADGKVYAFDLGSTNPTAGAVTPMVTNPIITEPIVLGGVTYAMDNTGTLKSSDGVADIALGAPATKAIAATGATSGTDSLVVATTDGTVAALPF